MAGICSAHQDYEPTCEACNALPERIELKDKPFGWYLNHKGQLCKGRMTEDEKRYYAVNCHWRVHTDIQRRLFAAQQEQADG